MANIKSSIKRIGVTRRKTAANKIVRSQLKTAIKRFEDALMAGDIEEARTRLRYVEKKFMQAASKNVVHKSTASRKISRLTKQLNKAV